MKRLGTIAFYLVSFCGLLVFLGAVMMLAGRLSVQIAMQYGQKGLLVVLALVIGLLILLQMKAKHEKN